MAAPTATEIREILECYGITSDVLSDAWLNNTRDQMIIPHIEEKTGMTFDGETELTEYYNGNGTSVMILNRRPVNSITSISLINDINESNFVNSIELIGDEGIIKSKTNFRENIGGALFTKGFKNWKIVYKVGADDYPEYIKRAIAELTAARALVFIGARTGGGSVQVQSHGRNYGPLGKYNDVIVQLVTGAYAVIRDYCSGVVGG